MSTPTVAVAIPVLDEADHLAGCLSAVLGQTHPADEVFVVDGGSTDGSLEIARRHPAVRVLHNPQRLQAAAMNLVLERSSADVIVRVDGRTEIAPDYVERCVLALARPAVALVGGAMTPRSGTAVQRAIGAALTSRFGAGPARFHVGGPPGEVDTVYLGAFRRLDALAVGGYDVVAVNEDAEFAIRMAERGAVWFDPGIRSTYLPRSSLTSLAIQFFNYGGGRAATVAKHPRSMAPRQAAPLVLLGALASPWRRKAAGAYLAAVAGLTLRTFPRPGRTGPLFAAALPIMHLSWALGFVAALPRSLRARRP